MVSPKPFVKWVGGKRQLLPAILPHLQAMGVHRPDVRYYEPFVGGGAVLFALADQRGAHTILNDGNPELVNLYRQVQAEPAALAARLAAPPFLNTAETYAAVRAWDRDPAFLTRYSPLDRAARFLFLNRTSFNGMWRVNKQGHYNVPFGHYKAPAFATPELLQACSAALKGVEMREGDFEAALVDVRPGDVVYFDPPYIPLSASAYFVGYTKDRFEGDMQERLAALCDRLSAQGVGWVLSNADVPLARTLFGRQPRAVIHTVQANRLLNSVGGKRGPVGEIVAVCPPL
jgi:DNA adenine methylase